MFGRLIMKRKTSRISTRTKIKLYRAFVTAVMINLSVGAYGRSTKAGFL